MAATGGSSAPIFASMFASSASSIGTGISQSRATRAQGDYEESVANTNAKLADLQGKRALSVGDAEAARREEQSRVQVGAARAGAGAGGADIGSASTGRAIKSIEDIGAEDELTIKNNAARTAWGFQTQGILDKFKGKMAQLTAKARSEQTLITGGLQAISGPLSIYSDYVRYKQRYNGKEATPSTNAGLEDGYLEENMP